MLHVPKCLVPLVVFASLGFAAGHADAAAPTFTSFSPASAKLGTTITINGTNFTSPLTVTFNGVATSSVTVISSTKATANVPFTATTGKIALKTAGGSVTGGSAFTVTPGMVASASSGPPTSSRTLYYSGFSTYEAVDFYFDNDDFALTSASAAGAGNLAVTIPADATPGLHWLTAVGRHSGYSGQLSFLVRADWPQLGFSPNHDGNNLYENVLSTDTVINLQEAWRTPGSSGMVSTPSVVGGIAYATFGDGTIRAFDELTGAQKWSFSTGGTTMFSSPVVSAGVVYAGSSDSYLYAVNAGTGTQIWRFHTGDIVYSTPTVSGGIVYFGSYDKNVYALKAGTGTLVWSFTTGGAVFSSPAVAKGVVYVGSFDEKVYALNATSGAEVWSYSTGALVLASPILVGGLVCVGSEDKIMYALQQSDGSVAWTYTTSSVIDSTAAVVGTTLFFGNNSGVLYSLSGGGAVRWTYSVPTGGAIRSPVSAANGVVYTTDGSYTYAFSAKDGTLLATLPVGSSYGGSIAINGAVVAGDNTEHVLTRYTLNAAAGNSAAPRPEPSQLHPRPLP